MDQNQTPEPAGHTGHSIETYRYYVVYEGHSLMECANYFGLTVHTVKYYSGHYKINGLTWLRAQKAQQQIQDETKKKKWLRMQRDLDSELLRKEVMDTINKVKKQLREKEKEGNRKKPIDYLNYLRTLNQGAITLKNVSAIDKLDQIETKEDDEPTNYARVKTIEQHKDNPDDMGVIINPQAHESDQTEADDSPNESI